MIILLLTGCRTVGRKACTWAGLAAACGAGRSGSAALIPASPALVGADSISAVVVDGHLGRLGPAGRALDRAAAFLSAEQLPNGGFQSYGDENSESVSQVILALCENGISLDDPRFQKPGGALTDALERFACPDGSFRHTLAGEGNLMATEQALCALAAIHRAERGESTLYAMAPAAD